jgi:acyl dehydratase
VTLTVGDLVASRTYGPITRTDIVRHQGASGDFSPLDHDRGFAEKAGYKTALSVGMLQAGYLVTPLAEAVGPEYVRSARIRLDEPSWPGGVLECAVSVNRIDGNAQLAKLVISATKQAGTTAVSGTDVVDLTGLASGVDSA